MPLWLPRLKIFGLIFFGWGIFLSQGFFAFAEPLSEFRIETGSRSDENSETKVVTGQAHFPVPTEKLWALLDRVEDFSSFLPRFRSVESFVKSPSEEKIFVLMEIPWPFPNIWNILSIQRIVVESQKEFIWKMLDGNLKKNEGILRIRPEGKNSILEVELSLEFGFFVPRWLLLWSVKNYLPKVLTALGKKAQEVVPPSL